ncbi:uncharacterized protein P884DRAFT_260296 [Thermothelomyces heterothallicus CBS 202.75]|uniref:uncharacterized protein n=1 Tax=Thermothelomyces heterothallicus CBS 202.75 TaxID=1149848 RepID=UPI0037431380
MKYSAPLLVTAGLAAAQSSVVTVLLPQFDQQAIDASVIAAAPTATTYRINCPPGADSSDCGVPDEFEFVYGPSTFAYTMSMGKTMVATANCKLDMPKDTADCVGTMSEEGLSTVGRDTLTDLTSYMLPITITAGLDKLAASTGAGTAPAAPARTTTTGGTTETAETAGSTGTTGSTAATSSTQTGGVPPQITQNAVLVGAAALVGGAMLM